MINAALTISAEDLRAPGGASYRYQIDGFDATNNPENFDKEEGETGPARVTIMFQYGDQATHGVGVNGITDEALLSINIDRLRSFQEGPYRCRENAITLTHLEEALMWLAKRTQDRIARGVEGTHAR